MTIRFVRFFLVNVLTVGGCIALILKMNNGLGNTFPTDLFALSIYISVPIIIIQYPILNAQRNWAYKIFVFYLTMVVFLFLFGAIGSWDQEVGASEAGWLARVDAGFRMMVFGQFLGGFPAFLSVVLINLAFKGKLFKI